VLADHLINRATDLSAHRAGSATVLLQDVRPLVVYKQHQRTGRPSFRYFCSARLRLRRWGCSRATTHAPDDAVVIGCWGALYSVAKPAGGRCGRTFVAPYALLGDVLAIGAYWSVDPRLKGAVSPASLPLSTTFGLFMQIRLRQFTTALKTGPRWQWTAPRSTMR